MADVMLTGAAAPLLLTGAAAPLLVTVMAEISAMPSWLIVTAEIEMARPGLPWPMPGRPLGTIAEVANGRRVDVTRRIVVVLHRSWRRHQDDVNAQGRPWVSRTVTVRRSRLCDHGQGAQGRPEQEYLRHGIASFSHTSVRDHALILQVIT
jgi:hypothetical protein